MRKHILAGCSLLLLAACNGGEDFSDATVPGCPIGTKCDLAPQGDVLIEFMGPQVAGLGFECGSSLGFTSDSEQIVGEEQTTVPAYTAICPPEASSIEFFLGSALFEGNKVSFGSYLLPRNLQKGSYQVTMADLIQPPTRSDASVPMGDDTNDILNRLALLFALDSDGDGADNLVLIPDEANNFINNSNQFVPDMHFDGYADYADFTSAWNDVILGVNAQTTIEGFEADTNDYASRLQDALERSRAGLYAFENAGECTIFQGCDIGSGDGSLYSAALRVLVLPDGSMLSGGQVARSGDAIDTTRDVIGFQSDVSLSDTNQIIDGVSGDPGGEIRGADVTGDGLVTLATLQGRILGQTLYVDIEVDEEVGSDYDLDYPSAEYVLVEDDVNDANDYSGDIGELRGTVLDQTISQDGALPIRATKVGQVQPMLDSVQLTAVSNRTYTLRLMRACVGEGDDNTACTTIPDPDTGTTSDNEEIGDEAGRNYPSSLVTDSITVDVTDERPRLDENDVQDICISINSEGLLTTGDSGVCGSTHVVGMVTRTLPDTNSVNVAIRLAPGIEDSLRSVTPHFNVEIQGRINLDDACAPMLRLSDESFDIGVRGFWLETFYLPDLKRQQLSDPDNPTDQEALNLVSLQSGAVIFFDNQANGGACDPLAP